MTGAKVWTSYAHESHYAITLVRTDTLDPKNRHAGLSQLIVDLTAPGVTIRPIRNLAGEHDFNEIVLDRVFVPSERLVGREGDGWRQVTSELAFERSGPERFLSSQQVLVGLVERAGDAPDPALAEALGRLGANLWTLRQMSLSVAGMLQAGETPNLEAALVKDLGGAYERAVPERARRLTRRRSGNGGGATGWRRRSPRRCCMRRRGRCAAARARSCAASSPAASGCAEEARSGATMRDTILYDSALRLFGDHVTPRVLAAAEAGTWPAALWQAVDEAGYLDVLAEGTGGMVEAVAILRAAGHHAAPIPLPETMLARWLCAASGIEPPAGPLSIALAEPDDPGQYAPVPWGGIVEAVAIVSGSSLRLARAINCASCPAPVLRASRAMC